MKSKNLLLFCYIFCFFITKAQRPFITTWSDSSRGVSSDVQIHFRATGSNFTVSWVNTNNANDTGSQTASGDATVTFGTLGIYKVYITPGSGTFSAITLYTGYDEIGDPIGDNGKLLSIEQWGDIQWTTFNSAFSGCYKMVLNAADSPDLSNVTDVSSMFEACRSLTTNAAMSNWNTSHVQDMSNMFSTANFFNQPIDNWDVSNVTSMYGMFTGTFFNQPIGNWNVSNVTTMQAMFYDAPVFNQPIGNWNVGNVTNMGQMFEDANSFNQPIGNWNVGKVTNMLEMFEHFYEPGAYLFNQPLGNWNVSNVTDMGEMFYGAQSFNQPIGNWNVSNVTDMSEMFYGAQSFNQSIGNWNVSNVIYMGGMFEDAQSFNQSIGTWNVSNVTIMGGMFEGAKSFNKYIGNWNVSNVTSMGEMFKGAKSFNQAIVSWNTSKVVYMGGMFYDAFAFNQNLGAWSLRAVYYTDNMLDSSGLSCNHYSQTLKGWSDSASTPRNLTFGALGLKYDIAFAQAAHDNLTNVKRWTITGDEAGHCSVVLPVNFISFNAIQQGNAAVLNWQVADEVNAKGYDAEKSENGYSYNAIGFVNADGKRTGYTFTDNNLAAGTSYYRIKEVDNDGKYMYSAVRKIEYSKFSWKINGNPVRNSSVQLILDKAANISIQVVSSNGNVIKTIQKGNLTAGNYNIPLNINNISTGVYLVRLMVDDKAYSSTVVK